MGEKKYSVGVVGYGLSAKVFHIPLIKVTPEFTLHSIVQRKPSPGSDASIDHPSAKIYTSAADMLADASIDLIVLTTPPNTHSPLARSALEAGKHVLVEKPFVPTAAEARELERLAAARQRLICVYQNRRWDADFLTFRRLQRDGALGRIVEFETHFDRWKPERPPTWKGTLGMADAGGVLYDLGTHLVDQVLVAFGVPRAVTGFFAHERNDGGPEPDAFTALLHYGPGAPLVTVKAGIMSAETAQLRYWVRGTKGSYKKFHLDVQEDQLKAGMLPGDEGFGVEHEDRAGAFTAMEGGTPVKRSVPNVTPETYGALYAAFAKAIEEGDEKLVPVKASEAGDVLRIIEAIQESAREGKTITL